MAIIKFNPEEFDPAEITPLDPTTGVIRGIGDVALNVAKGAVTGVKGMADSAGANNTISKFAQTAADFLDKGISQGAKDQDAINQFRSQAAEGKGAVAEIGAALQNFAGSPLDTIASGAGTIIPAIIAAKSGKKLGLDPVKTAVGTGAVMGAGFGKGAIYDEVERAHLDAGKSPEEAARLATEAQSYGGDNTDMIALAGGLGALASGTGVESAILTGLGKKVAEQTAKNVAAKVAKDGLVEAVPEAIQGGQEKLAGNLAVQREGFDRDLMAGVYDAATIELLAGGGIGAGVSAVDSMLSPREKLNKTLKETQGGAITDAAIKATETGATDVTGATLALPNYAGEPMVVFPDGTTMTRAEAEQRFTADELAAFEQRIPSKESKPLALPAPTFIGDANGRVAESKNAMENFKTTLGIIDNVSQQTASSDVVAAAGGSLDNQPDGSGATGVLESDAGIGAVAGQPVTGDQQNNVAGISDGQQYSPVTAVDTAANEAATSPVNNLPEPTDAQKEAGNYKVGRAKVSGLDVSVENPHGSTRSGRDKDGNEWSRQMTGHYGYIRGVKARARDKEHVDVNVKAGTADTFDGDVFIVNQVDPATGKFDEPKAYIGYASQQEAEAAYRSNYAPDWQGMGGIVQVPMARFKEMLNDEKAFLKPVKSETNSTKTGEVERYQWMRNKEGGQEFGNQQTIEPLTKELFERHVKDKVEIKDYDQYIAAFPATHISTTKRSDGVTLLDGVGSLNELRPKESNGWSKKVDSFDSEDSVKQGSTADSDTRQGNEQDLGEIRPIVESLTKRRAAAAQINREKPFDRVLSAAKKMMAGEPVKVGDLRMQVNQLKGDKELHEAGLRLLEIAKAPAKTARAERAQSAEGYRSRISQAKTEAELQAIAGEIAKDAKLTDTQAADLDDAVMEAMDALDDSGLNDAEEKLSDQIADEVVAEVEADTTALEPKPGDSENAAYLKEQVNERIEQEDGKQAVADAERQAEADIADGSKESGEEVEASEVNVESDLSRVDAGKVLINAKDGYRIQKVGDKYHYSAAGNAEFKTEKLTRDELVEKLAGKKMPTDAEQVTAMRDALLGLIDAKESLNVANTISDQGAQAKARMDLLDAEKAMRDVYGKDEATPLIAMSVDDLYALYDAVADGGESQTQSADVETPKQAQSVDATSDGQPEGWQDSVSEAESAWKEYDRGQRAYLVGKTEYGQARFGKSGITASMMSWDELPQNVKRAISMVFFKNKQVDIGQNPSEVDKAKEAEGESAQNDRDHFTLERFDREENKMVPITFERGEYVKAWISSNDWAHGEIEGISHAEKQAKIDGVWYDFAAINKAQRPAVEEKPTVPLSSVIEKANEKNGDGLGFADRIHTIAVHDDLVKRVRAGEVSAGEFKAAFDGLLKNKDAILAELDDMSKQQLLDRGLPYWAKNEKKARVVDAAYRDMMDDFTLGNSISYSMGEKYENVIRRIVDKINDEELKQYAESVKQASEERQAAMAEIKAGMENPQTLEDFTRVLRGKMNDGATFREAFMTLSPEQREQYDTMASTKTRSERMARKEHQKTDVRAAVHTTTGDIIETKHTKTGEPLFVVKAAERVEREVYNQWNQTAKRLGGWYSSFRGNGAVPGFQFKTRENAEAFLKYLGGDVNEAKEALQAKRDAYADDKSQTAVERLTEMADKLDERADESLGAERKANTARRARFAAAAEAAANADKAMAQTMRNIAAGIENGTASLLDQVRQKVQVELLQGMVTSAHYDLLRSKYKSYADYEQHKSEKPTKEVADYVEFPNYTASKSDLAGLGRRLLENEGTKKLGQRIMSVADDVTDAYLKFAKENLHKVSRYGTADGKPAIFANKQQAEKAISRSGFKGKAIVLPFKRGENMIILSPSEAMKQGIWEGDNDKRITLNPDFGAELVEKLGKANRLRSRMDAIDVPWQFENAYDKRKRLSAMGIETPAELRAAIREFVGLRQTPKAPDRVKELERAMIGRRNDGLDFFPTPAGVADQMVESAELKEGMSVLEPSAGMGHIADRIRESGVEPDVVEISGDRRELLEAKGYNLVGDDFMSVDPRGFTFGDVFKAPDGKTGIMRVANRERVKLIDENGEQIGFYTRDELEPVELRGADRGYDRIIMNPPFGDRRDAEHVRHAYELLRPGGRIVAIMGEGVFFGQDKKAQEFRAWLEEVGATDEKLEEGTFMDASLPVNTGVNARMVVIDKPEDVKGVLNAGATEKAAEQQPESKASEKIEDVGEKMAGARKDMEIAARKEWSDEDLAAQPLSKIWPAGDIDAIEDPYIAAWAFASRAEIPPKPRTAYKVARWVASVKTLRLINQMALDGILSKDVIQDKQKQYPALAKFEAKVRLLEKLPHDQWKRIGKVAEWPNAYTYGADRSTKIPTPQVHVEIDGANKMLRGSSVEEVLDDVNDALGQAAPEKRMEFQVRGSGSKFHIYKKGDSQYHKLAGPFGEQKEAFNYIKESYDDLVAAWDGVKDRENIKKTDVRGKGNKARTGENWRNGKNVTPEQFAEQFGFRGVEFGNWVSQGQGNKDRQGLLNQAYDGLMDLASIVGIPPKAISLNGSLGLAFGSRGKGWAAAHFEPGNLVINLTKTKGAGSLAHEWFHALDNYFSRMRGGEIPIERGINAQEAYRRQNFITYRPEPLYVHKSQPSKGMTAGNLRRYRELSKGSNYYAEENWQKDPKHPNGVRPEVESAFAAVVEALDASPMNARSKGADKGNNGYWSRIIERAARSFENYIIHKMRLNGYDNEYLANVTSPENFPRNAEIYPYLLETEIQPVADAFDNLFSTIQTKETEKGVAMFSRSGRPKTYPQLSDVLEQYEGTGEIATFTDLVDEVEAMIDADEAPESLQYAINDYREELAFDNTLSGRGDMDAAEERFIEQVRAAIGGGPGFSRQFTGSGMAVADVERAVNRIRAVWKNAPEIIVVDNMSDSRIRKAVRDENERQLSQGAEGQPEGFYDAGKVYIVASELNGEADIVRVLFHETLGHAGLRGLYGKELEKILDQVAMMRKKEVDAKAKQYGLDATNKDDRRIAAEEVLAEMAQTNPQIGFVKRAIAAIRNWLRKHVPYFKNLELTDADIIQGYLLPARRFVEIGKQDGSVGELVSAFMRRNRRPSKEQGDSFITAALEYLSRDPDFFQAQASEAKDIYAIGKDIDDGFRIETLAPSMTREKGADRAWEVFVPNSKHRAGTIMTKDDKVWVDLQYLRAGTDRGSRIYAVAADYAHNNGKVLIGDPAGLSRLAYYRRNENMLSSALKHGTTRHLMPHMAQMNPEGYWTDSADKAFAEQARPLTWVQGDDVNNIKELVYNSYDAAIKNVPEIKDVIYDPESGSFQYVDGRPFTDEDSERIAAELSASSRPYRAGSATIKRAALFNTFLRREGREGGRQLLGSLVDQLQGRGLSQSLLGVMYSRAQQDQTQTTQFKAWFGDSVVTDNGKPMSEGGKPLVVYRGGSKGRTEFKIGDGGTYGPGIYMTFDKDDAEGYASGRADGGQVYSLYARIENAATPEIAAKFEEKYQSRAAKEMQKAGYDGVIDPGVELVVFDSTQVKSATQNQGTFDPENADIRFSRSAAFDSVSGAVSGILGARSKAPKIDGYISDYAEQNRRLREEHITLWDKAKTWLKRQLAPGGLLPQSVFAEKINRDNEFQATEFDVAHLVGQLEKAIAADYNIRPDDMDEKVQSLLSDALAGNISQRVPESTRTALVAMRQYIDGLSGQYLEALKGEINMLVMSAEASGDDQLIAQAISKIELYETIAGNVGEYVHRSYRAFDDADWPRKVPDNVIDDARNYLIVRFNESGEIDAERRAEVVLNEILKHGTAYENMEGFIKESKLGAKDLSVLKRRKEIAPEIRALLGEYKDPRINFAKSATKMSRMIFNQRFLESVLSQGMGSFLFTNENKPPEATSKISADSSEAMSPLNGLWVTPEVNQAFIDALGKEKMEDWYRKVVQINGMVKYGKTVLSPTTAARNWMSAYFFTVANGHFNMKHMRQSVAGLKEYFGHGSDKVQMAYLRKLKQLGVVYDTPNAGEMFRLLQDANLADSMTIGKRNLNIKKMFDTATKFYQYGDDFWKIVGFENEKRMWMEAGMSEREAEVKAAERIRNTYPTYSLVGKGIQSLRRFPLAGTFVSFPAEIIRTSINMVRYLAEDYQNPATRSMAIRRGIGLAITSSFAYAAQAMTMAALGFDDEDDEAVRQMAAPWQRNSSFWYFGRDESGNLQFMDLSFLDPYNYWKRPIIAVMRGQQFEQAIKDVFAETLTPFFGTDITAGAIFEVAANKKDSGAPVFKPHDDAADQVVDIANHMRKALQPGIFNNMERTYKALAGETTISGRKYDPLDEAAAWVGFRTSTLDPKVALFYRSFDFKDAKAEAEKGLRDLIRTPGDVSESALIDARNDTIRLREQAYRKMINLVQAAGRSGMSRAEIANVLRSSSISVVDAYSIMNGTIPQWQPSAATMKDQAEKARTTFGEEGARRVFERYRMLMAQE